VRVPTGDSTHFAWLDARYAPMAYELEVGSASDLTKPLFNTNVYSSAFDLAPGLAVGSYYWRVRAKAGAVESAWASPQEFAVMDMTLRSSGQAVSPQSVSSVPRFNQMKMIPWFMQNGVMPPHKDTAMLCLECEQETGPHAWDMPHPVGKRGTGGNTGVLSCHAA